MAKQIEFVAYKLKGQIEEGNMEPLFNLLGSVPQEALDEISTDGERSDIFRLSYNDLVGQIKAAGITWLPALLLEVVEACTEKKPFRIPLSQVVADMEKKRRLTI